MEAAESDGKPKKAAAPAAPGASAGVAHPVVAQAQPSVMKMKLKCPTVLIFAMFEV